jgi:cell division protein FtsB
MARKASKMGMKQYVWGTVLLVLLIWLVFLNVSIYRKEVVARAAAHDTQVELTSMQTREKSLQASVNELSTERGQEEVLRETYGVAKPGEGVIIVVPPTAASTTPPESFWQKWFGWMKFW